jgi:riboflavin kinase / FMN adenylyltransferase
MIARVALGRGTGGPDNPNPGPSIASLGNFDGVHRGHQALVAEVVQRARAKGALAVVATFDPHPATILRPGHAPLVLMSLEQKAEALDGLGVDRLAVLRFDLELAGLSGEEFALRILRDGLHAETIVVGAGFRFGRGRSGGTGLLRGLGFEVVEREPELQAGSPVSSTRVRDALARGDVGAASDLLGRPFANDGVVVQGDRRGRELGFPTANLAAENAAVPAAGVYACWCRVGGRDGFGARHAGVVHVGQRPTFAQEERRLEAHLLDFSGDLYGSRLRVEYVARLRGVRRFENVAALVAQVGEDVQGARELLVRA